MDLFSQLFKQCFTFGTYFLNFLSEIELHGFELCTQVSTRSQTSASEGHTVVLYCKCFLAFTINWLSEYLIYLVSSDFQELWAEIVQKVAEKSGKTTNLYTTEQESKKTRPEFPTLCHQKTTILTSRSSSIILSSTIQPPTLKRNLAKSHCYW